MVAASVMRKPAANSDLMPSRRSICAIFGAHGMAAIFDDDGFLVILLHVRQRLGQDTGLIERTDVWRVGHEAGLLVSRVGRFLSDWRARRKACPLRLQEMRRGHAAATASSSQLTIRSVPPVGAAI